MIPVDLADQIRTLNPALLREAAAVITWRVESGLLAETVGVQSVGVCASCGARMPSKQTGRCVSCCLAAAQVLEERRTKAQATYPQHPVVVENPDKKSC